MAYSTISKPSLYFNTKLYTGNGTDDHAITGVGFQPDWVWLKNRSTTNSHYAQDVVRGATKNLKPDATDAEETRTGSLKSFDSDGFTLGTETAINGNGNSLVSWNWKAGGGQGSSNTDGSINTTYTSANTTAGFSIATWTTPSSGTVFDIGHGLGGKPDMMIMKSRSSTGSWWTWHIGLGDNTTDYLSLNSTNAEASLSGMWGTVGAGTSTFGYTAGTSAPTNNDTVAYFFKSVKGFSKFGSYTGNGNSDGSFIYTGFKPAWIMMKKTSSGTGRGWFIFDNKRIGYNPKNYVLEANDTAQDGTNDRIDLLSNGFKLRTTDLILNESGVNYIYMAFAEEPLVANVGASIPATAR
jgi:hypothetical protein